jgi:hypothetical protein
MSEPTADLSASAARAGATIERFMDSGHVIRALVELRALLEESRFWSDPEPDPAVRAAYLKSVDHFAQRGVSEAELKITLHA